MAIANDSAHIVDDDDFEHLTNEELQQLQQETHEREHDIKNREHTYQLTYQVFTLQANALLKFLKK